MAEGKTKLNIKNLLLRELEKVCENCPFITYGPFIYTRAEILEIINDEVSNKDITEELRSMLGG